FLVAEYGITDETIINSNVKTIIKIGKSNLIPKYWLIGICIRFIKYIPNKYSYTKLNYNINLY
ncbi:MAG: hypothetical protein MJ252_15745, partial [archaeon]|nr:hypothetical protein [archaeon]